MHCHPATPTTAERMLRYAWRIYAGGELTTRWMRERFGISQRMADRDLNAVIKALPVALAVPRRKGVVRRVSLSRRVVRRLLDE